MKTFRSGNWDTIKGQQIKTKVLYTFSDLHLTNTDQVVCDVPTTVVIIENEDSRFVGVAQCGPRDDYDRNKGREIAAGRALKQLARHAENPEANPSDVWESDNKQILIFGDIPLSLEDDSDLDRLVFGSNYE